MKNLESSRKFSKVLKLSHVVASNIQKETKKPYRECLSIAIKDVYSKLYPKARKARKTTSQPKQEKTRLKEVFVFDTEITKETQILIEKAMPIVINKVAFLTQKGTEIAKDCFQKSIIKFLKYNKRHNKDVNGYNLPSLIKILTHSSYKEVLNYIKSQYNKNKTDLVNTNDNQDNEGKKDFFNLPAQSLTAETNIIQSETVSQIESLLSKFPKYQQEIFKLYSQGFKSNQIAKETSRNENTIKQFIRNIKLYLQENLKHLAPKNAKFSKPKQVA